MGNHQTSMAAGAPALAAMSRPSLKLSNRGVQAMTQTFPIRTTVLLAASVLLSAGAALAENNPTPMDDAKCAAQWTMASPDGETLPKDKAAPYVLNFTMVDSDADGKISAAEFKKGCAAGQIKAADRATTKDMEGSK
jgi:hypothetical protein